jgi:hypothetical protein
MSLPPFDNRTVGTPLWTKLHKLILFDGLNARKRPARRQGKRRAARKAFSGQLSAVSFWQSAFGKLNAES